MDPTKHREISRLLLAEIASGKFGPHGRMPSEAQLVKRFRVSRPTVARALRDLQDEGLIERRAGSGTYVRAQTAKASAGRQLALLVTGLSNTEIFELICGELASLARAHEYILLWGSSGHGRDDRETSEANALAVAKQFVERRVAGVFFAPFELRDDKEQPSRAISELFREAGVPVVLLDRELLPFPQRSEFDLVGIDNFAAGYQAAEHLLKLGCGGIAFLTRPTSVSTVEARIAGVREALWRRQQAMPRDWLRVGDPEDARWVGSWSTSSRYDAVICANDLIAAQLLRSLEKNKLRVPNDLRVVGFDDAKYATLVSVPLTTIHQPCREIALTAYRAMLERIAEPTLPPRSLLLTPRLVIRESCGAYLPRPKA